MHSSVPFPVLAVASLFVAALSVQAASPAGVLAPDCPATAPSLLHERWPASWIAHPTASRTDYGVFLFRKSFELRVKPRRFVVHVSADNRYRLFVNGRSVCFGPQRSDLLVTRFDSVDLAPYLVAGPNVIAAEVVNYGAFRPAALVSLGTAFILQGDGPAEEVANTGTGWRGLRVKGYSPVSPSECGIRGYYVAGPGDAIDGRSYPWGWTDLSYDDSRWDLAQSLGRGIPVDYGPDVVRWLAPRNIPLLPETLQRPGRVRRADGVDVTASFLSGSAPIFVPAHSHATVLLDQGYETLTFPFVIVSGGRGSRVTLAYAEALVDGKGAKGNRDDIQGRHLEGLQDRFIADGGAHRRFEPLDARCYRYLELRVSTGDEPLSVDELAGYATGYPFHRNASFSCDDPGLGKIWNVGWRTARLCAFETYMDCPYYERLQYVGDTRIQALISLYVSGDDRLVRNAIEQADRSRLPEGLTQSRAPSEPPQVINTFSLFWVEMVHDEWMLRDHPAFIKAHLDGVQDVLRWFEERVDRSTGMLGPLPYWTFVDWTDAWPWNPTNGKGGEPPGAHTGGSSIATLQFAIALDDAAHLLAAFGRTDAAKHDLDLAASLRAATIRLCWDKGRGFLADTPDKREFSQHANTLAVLSGAVTGTPARDLMTRTLADRSLVACTLYFRFYLLRAMKEAGLGDNYVAQLGPWRDMLALGLSTFAEKPDPTRSDCHAWSASPVYEFLATVCGIEPASPGFKTVLIAPHPGPLHHVEGSMPHPFGEIRVSIDREGATRLRATVDLPAGLTGVFEWNGCRHALHPGAQTVEFN